jgi:hypothetical protein
MALTNYSPHIPIRISAPRPLNFYNTEYIKFKTTFLKKSGASPLYMASTIVLAMYTKNPNTPPFFNNEALILYIPSNFNL